MWRVRFGAPPAVPVSSPKSPAVNIDKFKHQHLDILRSIDLLRQLTHAGVERNAAEIARSASLP